MLAEYNDKYLIVYIIYPVHGNYYKTRGMEWKDQLWCLSQHRTKLYIVSFHSLFLRGLFVVNIQ